MSDPLRGSGQPSEPLDELCSNCKRQKGLCERCLRILGPRLAQVPWNVLMGFALCEQTKLQDPEPEERAAVERIKRRNERKTLKMRDAAARARQLAKTRRGGALGLARAIQRPPSRPEAV